MASVPSSRMPRTDMKTLMLLPVPLSSLAEQRRVVGMLNLAARIERRRAQAQELMRAFIPALFVRMFGDPGRRAAGGVPFSEGERHEFARKRGFHLLLEKYYFRGNAKEAPSESFSIWFRQIS